MTLIVLKPFRDKETGIVYNPKDEAEFSEERAAVILADRRKLAKVKETEKPAARSRKKK